MLNANTYHQGLKQTVICKDKQAAACCKKACKKAPMVGILGQLVSS